ncbi:HIT family protein [Leptospira ilyithenensis]|uniref:HIT family protein n=1 Tax=Leptospira ilyithenensis TaxID=2484901 RepID=UPI001FE9EE0B|nr:HIT domain-containing protein [Leptospira ilyithenensis]
MITCPICDSQKEKINIIQETKHWVLREAPSDKSLSGYLYLESKRHVESWASLTKEECSDYGQILFSALESSSALEVKPEKIYFAAIAEKVPHLHVHLVPRYEGQEKGISHLEKALGPGFSKPL